MRLVRNAVVASVCLGGVIALPLPAAASDWVDRVNFYRGEAFQAPITEDPNLDPGAVNHSRYMVENNVITHQEDPSNRWYTPDGNQAGTHGNVAVEGGGHFTPTGAIDLWMTAPYHALGILNPNASRFGYGQFDANVPCCSFGSGATLDTLTDARSNPIPAGPIAWPGSGANVPLLAYGGNESPNPEEFCPPHDCVGLPIVIITSNWAHVTGWQLKDDSGAALEMYEFDGSNTGSDSYAQAVLQSYGGVILFPRQALRRGHTYTAAVTIAGKTYRWTFTGNPSNHTLGPGGYTIVAADGGVYPFGSAHGRGGFADRHLNSPIITVAGTPTHGGYWMVAGDGGVFPFGDAGGYGSTGGMHLNRPVVGMAATATGRGYWLVASDGGIFPFGDALQHSYGSTGNIHLNQPIVGMARTASGGGYWLVASDGGIFPFGDATQHSYGSTGNMPLNRPIIAMTATPDGNGYWLVAADGGVFPFGNAGGFGSTGDEVLNGGAVGLLPAQ